MRIAAPSFLSKLLLKAVAVSSLVWLVAALPFLALHNGGIKPFFTSQFGFIDLPQYYMGGSIALTGNYNALYPVPKEGVVGNLGLAENSTCKPDYARLAEKNGVEDTIHFILPPPTAQLLVPLALFPYPVARWVWICLLGLFTWLACALGYRTARTQGITRFEGAVWWGALSFSPLAIHSLRIANCTPILAVALGLAATGIYKNRTALSVSMCILAGLLKGTSILFAPLILFMRRWKVAGWGILITLLILLLSIWITGREVYEEFFTIILPSTRIVVLKYYNRSIYAFLVRAAGEGMLGNTPILITKCIGIFLFAAITSLAWVLRKHLSTDRGLFTAAVVGLLGIYMIFSPYAWAHYAICYLPFLPSLWTALRSRGLKFIMGICVSGLWLPPDLNFLSALPALPEPFASHLLFGQIGLIALTFCVLIRAARELKQNAVQ